MTGAALALAMAVLIAPVSSRRRVRALMMPTSRRRRPSMMLGAVAGCAAMSALLPWTAVLALGLAGRHAPRAAPRRSSQTRRDRGGRRDAGRAGCSGGRAPRRRASRCRDRRGRPRVPRTASARSLSSVAARALLGADVAAGLRAEAARSTSPGHWERLAVCWQLAQTHGLAIATLMQAAQRDIVERERFHGRVEAGMAGARATAAILAGLPVARGAARSGDRCRSVELPTVRRGGRMVARRW